ncbi:MAG TPA: hypothetical protein VMK42_13580 [Anaeromyxobacteraceae bacterium]|nr:hypothetical protein [Anaeromyxobacteraceae bacterium]
MRDPTADEQAALLHDIVEAYHALSREELRPRRLPSSLVAARDGLAAAVDRARRMLERQGIRGGEPGGLPDSPSRSPPIASARHAAVTRLRYGRRGGARAGS